jgi:hypothetical protein
MKAVFTSLALVTAFTAFSQRVNESEVPVEVQEAFATDHPEHTDVKWEKEGDYFEAEVDIDGTEYGYYYYPNGKPYAQEMDVDPETLPEKVTSKVEGKIKSASVFKMADGTEAYEVETRNAEYFLHFTGEGVDITDSED